jgi:hypothetical protein
MEIHYIVVYQNNKFLFVIHILFQYRITPTPAVSNFKGKEFGCISAKLRIFTKKAEFISVKIRNFEKQWESA